MDRQLPTVSEQIRQLIDECGVSRYRIAKETGVSEPALSHFMSGKTGLSMRARRVGHLPWFGRDHPQGTTSLT